MNNRRNYTYIFGPFGLKPDMYTLFIDTDIMQDYATIAGKNFTPRFFRRLAKEDKFHDIIML